MKFKRIPASKLSVGDTIFIGRISDPENLVPARVVEANPRQWYPVVEVWGSQVGYFAEVVIVQDNQDDVEEVSSKDDDGLVNFATHGELFDVFPVNVIFGVLGTVADPKYRVDFDVDNLFRREGVWAATMYDRRWFVVNIRWGELVFMAEFEKLSQIRKFVTS